MEVSPEIIHLIKSHQKIAAIKLLREYENSSLKDAKEKVDAIEKDLAIRGEMEARKVVQTGPGSIGCALLITLLLVGLYFAFRQFL